MKHNLKNMLPSDFQLLMIAQENKHDKEGQYKEVLEYVEKWKKGFEKELRNIADLKEFDENRFKEGSTTKSRIRLLIRVEMARELLGEGET